MPVDEPDPDSPRESFKHNFELADSVLAYGERLPEQGRDVAAQGAGITQVVAFVAVAAYAKVLRQLHGTIRLCEVGLSQEALVLNRVALEALLLQRWALLPEVVLKQNGKAAQRPAMREPNADFRARLYLAHSAFAWMRSLYKDGERVFDNVSDAAHEQAREHVEAARRDIGADWTTLLGEHPFTYSTVNTRDLAASLGYLGPYDTMYSVTSQAIHAADAAQYAKPSSSGDRIHFRVRCENKYIRTPLGAATALALDAMQLFVERMGYPEQPRITEYRDRLVQHP